MIGDKLMRARKNNKLTLQEVQKLTGISNGNLSNYETNRNLPGAKAIITLCKLYKISADWLLLDIEKTLHNKEDLNFLEKYNTLNEREKGRIDQLIDEILKSK